MTAIAVERAVLAACRGVGVTFGRGDARVSALRDVDLEIRPGDSLALWGRSGSVEPSHYRDALSTPEK